MIERVIGEEICTVIVRKSRVGFNIEQKVIIQRKSAIFMYSSEFCDLVCVAWRISNTS
jgi:hypothetical protein